METNGEPAQGENLQQVAMMEAGDLPEILHWDGCAHKKMTQ